jgi:peptide/nickel transport system substrate-binding protein
MRFGPSGKIEPALAVSVSQPGPAVYVYHLRHGVRFWDGNELTATDVANAINYQRYPAFPSTSYLKRVKNVSARDRYTVVVTLRGRDPTWPYIAAFTGLVFEKKFADAHKGTFGQPSMGTMGTGPWIVKSFNPTTGMELSANPHWWGGKVNVQHISVKFFADDNSAALAMRAGAIDAYPPTSDVRGFAATSQAQIVSAPSAYTIGYFMMNPNVAPWDDLHVRRRWRTRSTGGISSCASAAMPCRSRPSSHPVS